MDDGCLGGCARMFLWLVALLVVIVVAYLIGGFILFIAGGIIMIAIVFAVLKAIFRKN